MSQVDLSKLQPQPRTTLETGTGDCRECRMGTIQAAQVNAAFNCPTHGTRVVELVPASQLYAAQLEIRALKHELALLMEQKAL